MFAAGGNFHFRTEIKAAARKSCERFLLGSEMEVEQLPEPSGFKKVNTEVPTLPDYSVPRFPSEYWESWPSPVENLNMPWLKADQVQEIWNETRCVSRGELEQLLADIRHGCDIGCRGDARLPTVCKNNKSADEYGDRLADNLVTWIKNGIASGPFCQSEIDKIFPNGFKINPLQVALKEDGKAR